MVSSLTFKPDVVSKNAFLVSLSFTTYALLPLTSCMLSREIFSSFNKLSIFLDEAFLPFILYDFGFLIA